MYILFILMNFKSLISRTINNRQIFVHPHATVLQACEAVGVDVPRFCYHEKLSVAGNCRICLVEVQKSPKPVVSCAIPVAKGRVVYTDTPLVRKAREAVLEFLLLNHPLDCPICDQGGECDLQDEVLTYGTDRGRYYEFKHSVEDKECGPIVKTIRTRCIHCTRCVRFSTEVAGIDSMGAFGRGEEMEIGTYINGFLRTELSGNLVDLCPVGALTSKPYAYQARSWELQHVETLDFFDALCSDIVVHTRKRTVPRFINNKRQLTSQEEIFRILPNTNGYFAENWISDRTRYAFDGLNYSRLNQPIIYTSKENISTQNWTESLNILSSRVIASHTKLPYKPLYAYIGPLVNLERVYALASFCKILGSSNVFQGYAPAQTLNDAPFFYRLNQSVHNFSVGLFSNFFFVGTNIRFEASLLNTLFRREHYRRNLAYLTVGVSNTLRYPHNHQGNSFRTLISSLENRFQFSNKYYAKKNATGILLGVESLRIYSAHFLQFVVRYLGKFFFTKTAKNERLGYVHSSVGSLAFAHIGLNSSTFNPKVRAITFNFHLPPTSKAFFNRYQTSNTFLQQINFDTHFTSTPAIHHFPITTLYEREGHLRSREGLMRKHNKAVEASTQCISLETTLSALCRKNSIFNWFFWTEALVHFHEEFPREVLLDTISTHFQFNSFIFETKRQMITKSILFHQTVRNFYIQEPIAAYSSTRGECSLFLSRENNFVHIR